MNRVEHAEYIASAVWAARREKFKREHGRRCLACGSKNKPNVHHVTYSNAGAGKEPDRDLRLLCRAHHELAHKYEKSGRYGRFMARGTLFAATQAMIEDVQASPGTSGGARTRPTRSTSSRPPTRRDKHAPRSRSRTTRRRSGSGQVIGAVMAVVVVLVLIGVVRNGSSSPIVQQPPDSVTSIASVAQAPPVPPPPNPYLVQPGDTLQQIADGSGVSVADLLSWNPGITDPDYIDIGQTVMTAPPGG